MTKPRVFWVHFNRLNVVRGDRDVWTVHLSDQCIQTRKVKIMAPLETIYRGSKAPQPRAYLRGRGRIEVRAREVRIYPV